jgi:hypothetical protein
MLDHNKVSQWLSSSVQESLSRKYRHQLIIENLDNRPEILLELKDYIQNAHEDARRRLRKLAENTLDPLGETDGYDPAQGYPETLHRLTLQGYMGEVFAAIIAEYFSPFAISAWKVPAFLFRFHLVAFQQLEAIRQNGAEPRTIPGRTGDDCLAFEIDENWNIIRVLYCEAKCTASHDAHLITDAHEKVSEAQISDIPQLIDILSDYEDTNSRRWVNALRRLWMSSVSTCERYNLVTYLCGQRPKRERRWIAAERPHAKYDSDKPLEAVEIHLNNIEDLIDEAYGIRVVLNESAR